MLNYIKILFFSTFAVIGLSLFVYSIAALFNAHESRVWPSAAGRILEAQCLYATSKPATSARHVKYTYVVGSSSHVGEREYFGIRIANNNCTSGYKENQTVTIFYDPENPSISVLKPGLYKPAVFGLVVGAVFSVFGIGGYFYDRKNLNP